MEPELKHSQILIVEDDVDIRDTLQEVLQSEGYNVHTTINGLEALNWLRSNEQLPCIVLLDLMMPVMNGWQFLDAARADPVLSKVPVVVVSAVADLRSVPTGVHYVRKPINFENLLGVVRTYCRKLPPLE